MSKIKLSDYVAKRLKEVHKIEHFFMVSGGGAMHLNDSLGRYIPYTANHHEQACAIAAEGYARVNQKLALVNVTTGPGGLNCLNGVFGQWTDSVPVLYISGQVKQSTTLASCPDIPLRQLGDQEVDIISCVKPITKYAVTLTNPNDIKYHLDRAVYEATTGRFAPVWLDIPINLQAAIIDDENLREFIPPSRPDCLLEGAETVDIPLAVEKLRTAKRPLIVAGHGIRLSKTEEVFLNLLEKIDIPVVTTFNGVDILPTNHKNFCGRIGTVGQRAGNFTLQNADVILFLGTRNNIRQVSYNWENFAKNAYKIVVDIDGAELKKPLVKPDLAIQSDLKNFLPNFSSKILNTYTPTSDLESWLNFCKNLLKKYSFENTLEYRSTENINVYDFVHCLSVAMGEGDILVAGNGSACVCSHQVFEIKSGQRIFWNSGDASMGYDLPAAIGASYEANSRNVICLAGDGSIMMNIQELQTVVHNKLPLKIFVINNSGYSSIRQTQRNFFNGHMTGSGEESGVSVPDFVKVATAFGLNAKLISDPKTMREEIKEVLDCKEPILCEVMTEKEYAFLPKLSAKKLPDGTMVSPSLEDMFPFLTREEFEENVIR